MSRYYWGYYPTYYRLRPILPIHHYFHHLRVFVDVHHRYYYTTSLRFPVYVDVIRHHRRNDYWRDHNDRRFEMRNQHYRNKGQFEYNQERRKPDPRERKSTYSENDRRQANPGAGVPQRDTRVNPSERRPATPQRDVRVTPQQPTQQREIRVTPQRESAPSPSREVRTTPSREVKVSPPAKEVKVTPKVESKPSSSREVKVSTSSRDSKKSNEKSSSNTSRSDRNASSNSNSGRR